MKCLITGAGGFIGGKISQRLVQEGHDIVTFQRGDYPELENLGGRHFRGSIDQLELLTEAMNGVEAVFHVAALAAISGPTEDFQQANVIGTRHVIEACLRNGVKRLIFTSSPSVVFAGTDQNGE